MAFNSITNLAPYGTIREGYSWDSVQNIDLYHNTMLIVVLLGTHNLVITGGGGSFESHIDIMMGIRI